MSEQMVASPPQLVVRRSTRQALALSMLLRLSGILAFGSLVGLYFRTPQLQIDEILLTGGLMLVASLMGAAAVYIERITLGVGIAQLGLMGAAVFLGAQVQNTESVLLGVGVCMITLSALAAPAGQGRRWTLVSSLVWIVLLAIMISLPIPRRVLPEVVRNGITLTPLLLAILVCLPALRHFRHFPLRVKLMLLIVGLVETAVVVVVALMGVTLTRALTVEYGRDTVQTAEAEAQKIALLFIQEIDLLNSLSVHPLLREKLPLINEAYDGGEAAITAELLQLDERWRVAEDDDSLIVSRLDNDVAGLLRAFQQTHPENVELFVTDQYGALLASTGRTTDYYQADEAWWTSSYAQGQGALFIGDLDFDASSNSLGFTMATPIWNSQRNEILGVLRTTFLPTTLDELLATPVVAEREGRALLLIGQQEVYVEDDLLLLNDQSLQTSNLLGELVGNAERFVSHETAEGQLEAVSLAAVDSGGRYPAIDALNWEVLVFESLDEVFDIIGLYGQVSVGLTSATLLTVLLVVYFYSQTVLQSIEQLADVTARVQEGDLTPQTNIQSQDELGILGSVFNDMVRQMRQAVQTIELRVAERVQALETSAQIGERLVGILDFVPLAQTVVTEIQESFDYAHVQIFGVADESRFPLIAATGRAGEALLASALVVGEDDGAVGQAGVGQTAVLVPDFALQPELRTAVTLPESVAELAMPIIFDDTLLAILSVQQTVGKRLDQRDIELLALVLGQAAVTIRNVKQYAESQRRIAQQQQLNVFRQQILQTNDIQDALKVATQAIGQLVEADEAVVQLAVGEKNGSRR